MAELWRTGSKVPFTLYEGERFVGSVRMAGDAALIAAAMNSRALQKPKITRERAFDLWNQNYQTSGEFVVMLRELGIEVSE